MAVIQSLPPQIIGDDNTFQPIRIVEIELSQPLSPITAYDPNTKNDYKQALIVVRLHSKPLGLVELQLSSKIMNPSDYAPWIWQKLKTEINQHLQQDELEELSSLDVSGILGSATPKCQQELYDLLVDAPLISIVVATRDRPLDLDTCLKSLLTINYPKYEIIIVDTPSTSDTADLIKLHYRDVPNLRYICEDRPGISLARNRGLAQARGEIIFFTDDDTVADSNCLLEVARIFKAHPQVACITGLVIPKELESPAQVWFEQHTGSGKGFHSKLFDLENNRPPDNLYPYAAGIFGAGVHRVFRTKILLSIGGFDCALGPGSLGQAAEDFDVYFRVITSGYQIFYEPAVLVYHSHRLDYNSLRRQLYTYYVGIASFLTKCIIHQPGRFFELITKIPYGLFYILSKRSQKNSRRTSDYPIDLMRIEFAGFIYGFLSLAYIRSLINKRKLGMM